MVRDGDIIQTEVAIGLHNEVRQLLHMYEGFQMKKHDNHLV